MNLFKLRAACAFLLGFIPSLRAADVPLEVGAEAPQLSVVTDTGESLDLAEVYAEGPALIYFYPRAFTRGCTAQACNLRDNFDAVRSAGIRVLGVSRDSVETQARFREEESLPFNLVADETGALGKAFQVGTYGGAAYHRQTFLVLDGKIVWRDLNATPGSQSADAIEALKEARNAST